MKCGTWRALGSLVFALVFASSLAHAQTIIVTVAGNGTYGFSGDGGPATSASLSGPSGVAVDAAGDLYVADQFNHRIRKVNPSGTISTVAGNGAQGFSGDAGPATSASLNNPRGVALDAAGNLYIADTDNSRIRKVSASGIITTVAGNGYGGYSGDGGPATSSSLWVPYGVAVDAAGNLYIAEDGSNRVRKVSASGIISTVAGGGSAYPGDGGPATSARLGSAWGVAVDATGNLYVADRGNARICKVSPSGTISTVAGNGAGGFSGDGGPATRASLDPYGVAVDAAGNLYIADYGNGRVRWVALSGIITTVAGGGSAYPGDGGPATSASLRYPTGVAVDAAGNLYIADQNNSRVRKVAAAGGPVCSYTISSTSGSLPAAGGTGSVTVTAPTGCSWTASSNASWITITAGATGSGNGAVNYTVAANTSTSSRTGTLTIAGQTFTATQAGVATLNVSPSTLTFSGLRGGANPTGQSLQVTVTGGSAVSWTGTATTSSGGNWLAISPASGTTPGSISVSVNIAALAVGTYAGLVSITPAGGSPVQVQVALSVTAAATLNVSPATLAFTAQRGGTNPPAQAVQLTASDGSSIPWTATSSAVWLSVSPASGNTAANVSVSVTVTGLAAGSYTGQVSFVSGGGTPVAVFVSLTVSETATVIGVSPALLQFTASAGLNPAPKSITVSNQGGGTLTWGATIVYTSTAGWLSITPGFGTAPTSALVSIDVNAVVLRAGTYQGQILITSLSGATNSPLSVPVTLTVTSPAQLAVSPQFLSFQATQGSSTVVSQAISITNAGSGALNWTASAATSNGGDWLKLSATQGAAPAAITVSANPAGLAAGVYLGSIQITETAAGGKQSVFVALTVTPPATTILLSQSDFVFTSVENNPSLLKQTLRILNLGQGTLAWKLLATIPSGGSWLSVDQASGSTTTDPATAAPIGVLVNPAGLSAGNYYGLLIASSSGATNSPQLASVHLRVVHSASAPLPSVLPGGFIFAAAEGGAAPAAQAFSVQNIGGGALPFKATVSTTDGSPWLSASPLQATATGTASATVAVQASTGNLRAGVYRGSISLDFPAGLTQDLSVILLVTPAGTTPFANLERPAAGCAPTELQAVSTLLPNNFVSLVGWPVPIVVRVVDNCNNAVTGATVVATFAGADYAPLLLKSLRDGIYTGTWVPLSSSRVRVTIKALSPPLKDAAVELLSQPADFTANLPLINPDGVVNGASFDPRVPVAPGSIISLFGRNLVLQPTPAAALPLPTNLGGLALKIGDRDAPLFYANNGQVNAQVPVELASNTAASVVLTMNGKVSPPEPLLLAPVQPGVFTYDDSGVPHATVLDDKNALVSKTNPAARGTIVQVYATGLGPTDPPAKTGEPAPASPPALLKPEIQLTATIGGVPAEIQFKGLAPGYVGLYQVNLKVPSGLPAGDLPLVLTANGLPSKEVMLPVK